MTHDPHPDDNKRPRRPGVIARLRGNFLAGLIIVAPIGLTFWLIYTVVGWVDGWVWPFVPNRWHPDELINRWFGTDGAPPIAVNVRGVGVFVFLFAATPSAGYRRPSFSQLKS